ncbi:YkgJ family cysteine cluster protein [Streptococcus rupicaprae]|uniref:YkgJ family cysteine cluster protein n=1 Tax=Streptococcus rupicaprae TaxID=759619 RepID=UPI003399ACB2
MGQRELDIEHYRQLALQKQKEHRLFLAQLKRKPPKNLDKLVQEIHQEVFQEIDCTQCANCCKRLGPLFTEADITWIAKHFRMKLPAFESMFLRTDEDGDKVFQRMPCPFLGEDNLCSIYDVRPKACREFPHTDRKKIYQINHLTLKNTLFCPAAYLFVEKLRERWRRFPKLLS